MKSIKRDSVSIEQAVRNVSQDVAEEVRAEVSTFLKRAKPPKANLKQSELSALRRLSRNKDITILPADKGNATVILKTEDYRRKILDLLDDAAYRKLSRDPTESITKRTVELIKKSNIPTEISRNLRPQAPAPPRMYGLPKIHKTGIPLRPIVSAIGSPTYNLAKYLTGVLAPHVGNCSHHVKNSADFINTLRGIHLNPSDIMISLDVVSLFTRVPLQETLSLLEKKFDADTVKLFHHALTSTYFTFDNSYYEQKDGVAMGSPLSPAIANFFMEEFEEHALQSAPYRPKHFYRYVDDTFVIWPHGVDTLKPFLDHMNSRHPSIQFTMESEEEGKLPFLDILIQRKEDGSLSHKVYRKPTHTDLYLNAKSHHHPAQRSAVLSSLLHRAKVISDQQSLPAELGHLKKTFRENGFSPREISMALKRAFGEKRERREEERKPLANAFLPYISTVSGKISRILRNHNIRTVHLPPKKLRQVLVRAKDPAGLKLPGVYSIPCECGEEYIGETGRTIETRIKEHKRHLRLYQPSKSAVAEHAIDCDHAIRWEETKMLHHSKGYWDRLTKEKGIINGL
ncbi:uncharacterized protein [Hetaerina americana]|uniref:uncharacterized protein n=1 Tax=Hetaerina americana TaxID=62018 RepID=UPI003A7F2757